MSWADETSGEPTPQGHDDGHHQPVEKPAPYVPAYGQMRDNPGPQPVVPAPQPQRPKKRPGAWLVGGLVVAGLCTGLDAYQAGGLPQGWPTTLTRSTVMQVPGLPTPTPPASAGTVVQAAPSARPTPATSPTTPASRSRTNPTPGRESQPTPLGSPAPLLARSDAYSFIGLPDLKQDVVAYDPCRPIHYVTRAANAAPGGQDLINAGFAELSRVTGLVFINDGETLEGPSEQRAAYQPDTYGDRWAPVLVVWSTPEESPGLERQQDGEEIGVNLGYAGSYAVSPSTKDPYVYVTGEMVLNPSVIEEGSVYEGPALASAVIAHELAHLVGLGHVDDQSQLMNTESGYGVQTYADGDRTGLEVLGKGACSPGL